MGTEEKPDRMLELIGVAALSLAIFSYAYSILTSDYVATQGRVMGSSVTPAVDFSKPINRHQLDANTEGAMSYTRVTYRYEVNGQLFFGCADSETTKTNQPQRLATVYQSGRSVPVYFNPERPHDSHIWKEDSNNNSFLIFLGFFCYALAYLCRKFDSVSVFFGGTGRSNSGRPNELPSAAVQTAADSHNPSFG
jgi:hypothetical protein